MGSVCNLIRFSKRLTKTPAIARRSITRPVSFSIIEAMINGLPPTPIAMPSAEAIHAALHPEEGSSLYFVARGDGGHYFSDTLDEHRKAVRRYQIDGRTEDYQSAPTKP